MATFTFSTLANNQTLTFNPLVDVLIFDGGIRPAELLINGTASGVQFSVGGKSILLSGILLDDLGLSLGTAQQNVQFLTGGVLLVGEGTTAHDGGLNNTITGGNGNDALLGLGGDDVLDGGSGGDLMVGGAGNDTYLVENAADVVTEDAGAGIDLVQSLISYALTNNVENLTLLGSNAINGTGNVLANAMLGNRGDNVLDGKAGADTMAGGAGNDTYVVDSTGDVVTETGSALTQIDKVMSSVSYRLGANLENLDLTGTAAIVGVGNIRANALVGNVAANTLNGGAGADTMTGGDGNDTYFVDHVGDVVVETNNSASQIDLVASWISHALGDNVENIKLMGTAHINATGNALNNVIYANAGNNVLDGGLGIDTVSYGNITLQTLSASSLTAGTVIPGTAMLGVVVDLNIAGAQDTRGSGLDQLIGIENLIGSDFNDELTGNAGNNILDGGEGADILTGGKGNDTYYVDGADLVIEQNGAIDGIDTVIASVSYRLTAHVENLTLAGSAFSGHGNSLNNRLVGTSGANFLDGGAGADKMDGGAGNDSYVVDNIGDEITDSSGVDLVLTYVNQTLGATLENLRLMGTSPLNGTGNALSNIIWANSADNVMDGGANPSTGGDTLSYEFGATSGITLDLSVSVAQNTGGSGYDTVRNFENLTGSVYDDLLAGDDRANILDGLAGVDTISYASSAGAVVIDLTAETAVSLGVKDTLRNFENIVGSNYDDMMTGDLGDNAFDGGTGIDTVTYQNVKAGEGGVVVSLALAGAQNTLAAGTDSFVRVTGTQRSGIENLIGSVNDDSLTGDAWANALNGSAGDDSLAGLAGDDSLEGGLGDDLIDGGNGADTAVFTGSQAAVVNLSLNGTQDTGFGLDRLVSIENVVSGAGADRLTGNGGDNLLRSGLGDDTLDGGAGADVLAGGEGADRLTGGAGADVFLFDTAIGGGNIDRVADFSVADDTMHLDDAVFTALSAGVLAASAFVANAAGAATTADQRIIYETDTGFLFYDADGSGAGAAIQFATLNAGLALTRADFLVI